MLLFFAIFVFGSFFHVFDFSWTGSGEREGGAKNLSNLVNPVLLFFLFFIFSFLMFFAHSLHFLIFFG